MGVSSLALTLRLTRAAGVATVSEATEGAPAGEEALLRRTEVVAAATAFASEAAAAGVELRAISTSNGAFEVTGVLGPARTQAGTPAVVAVAVAVRCALRAAWIALSQTTEHAASAAAQAAINAIAA